MMSGTKVAVFHCHNFRHIKDRLLFHDAFIAGDQLDVINDCPCTSAVYSVTYARLAAEVNGPMIFILISTNAIRGDGIIKNCLWLNRLTVRSRC